MTPKEMADTLYTVNLNAAYNIIQEKIVPGFTTNDGHLRSYLDFDENTNLIPFRDKILQDLIKKGYRVKSYPTYILVEFKIE